MSKSECRREDGGELASALVFRHSSFLPRFLVNRVLAELLAVLLEFQPLRAACFFLHAVVPQAGLGAFQPDVFAGHRLDFPLSKPTRRTAITRGVGRQFLETTPPPEPGRGRGLRSKSLQQTFACRTELLQDLGHHAGTDGLAT